MKIYLASPFFQEEELKAVQTAEEILRSRGFELFSPRENEVRGVPFTPQWSKDTFENDRKFIDWADAMVMLYHGAYSDSGTAWECGYAYAKGKPVVVVQLAQKSNLMVHEGCRANISLEELKTYDFDTLPPKPWDGEMT